MALFHPPSSSPSLHSEQDGFALARLDGDLAGGVAFFFAAISGGYVGFFDCFTAGNTTLP